MQTSGQQAAQILLEKVEAENEASTRPLKPSWSAVVTTVAVAWSLFQMVAAAFSPFDTMTLRGLHVMFMLTLGFCLYAESSAKSQQLPTLWEGLRSALWIACGLSAFGYMVLNYGPIALRGGYYLSIDNIVATVGVVVCFELARRVARNLALLAGLFFAYNFVGQFLPGAFGHTGFSWNRVIDHLFWGSQGLLGIGVGVSATYIFLFVLFGSFLKASGFSGFINDLALTLVGRSAGGPAKVAVIASALMGMINGSALANVATTGAITIPLMKRTGYSPEFAAAVEAVASTGGQFAPPIMGAVGFIMAEFLGVPYTTVMLAATIPALLYYLTLLMAVHFEARKLGLQGLSAENIPAAMDVLRSRGHLAAPLISLLALMFAGFTPLYAATASIVVTIAASWLSPATRMHGRAILAALNEGARNAVGVGAACVIVGVIIGTVSLTGLGLTFGYEILRVVGEGQLYLAGFCVMVMSVILGMGVPGVAAYVIVAAVAVPVLIKVGASPLAAHMFCLIYACLSNITPPVAMSSYVAAGIAHANQTRTSFIAMRLGLTGFIIPFFFLDNPLLLYAPEHSLLRTIWAGFSACLGASALAAGLEGWLFGPCTLVTRGLLLTTGLLAIDSGLYTDMLGLGLYFLAILLNKQHSHSPNLNK